LLPPPSPPPPPAPPSPPDVVPPDVVVMLPDEVGWPLADELELLDDDEGLPLAPPLLDDDEELEPPPHCALQLFCRHVAMATKALSLLQAAVSLPPRQLAHVVSLAHACAWLQHDPLMQLMQVASPMKPHAVAVPPEELLDDEDEELEPPHSVAHSDGHAVLQMQVSNAFSSFTAVVPACCSQVVTQVWSWHWPRH
jgi:hypothetical protein